MKLDSQFAVPHPHEDNHYWKYHDILLKLLKEKAYKRGEYTLSSGVKSEHYVNCKPVTLSCEGNALLSHLLIEKVEDNAVAVAGLTLGADPLVCGIAQKAYYNNHKPLDALIIRKNVKGYGTKDRIEGPKPPKGSVVTVVEDVTTTGSSAMSAVKVLREAGYIVKRVIAIVDRMDDHSTWVENDLDSISLFTLEDITG